MLSRAFKDLIRRDHPDLIRRRAFGKRYDEDQHRDSLKFLSCWRLAQAGYTAKEAIELAKRYKVETYESERAYWRAIARAERKITELEDSLQQLAARIK